jgi:hypothetical protein
MTGAPRSLHAQVRRRHKLAEPRTGTRLALWARMRALPMAFISLCAGCASLYGAARDQAAIDLKCPEAQISTYQAPGGRIVARGCGAWAEYECIQTGTEPRCVQTDMPPQKGSFSP